MRERNAVKAARSVLWGGAGCKVNSLPDIEFRLSDIKKIYLKNEKYIDDFIRYFPDYKGAFYVFME